MASQFIQDILDRIEKLEGKQPTIDLDRQGIEVAALEQEVRRLNVSKEYRRRIEDLEARWAVLSLHFSGFDNKTHLRADAVVDSTGKGTHIHLRNAIADAITDGNDYFIWVNQSATASNMDLGGMATGQHIYIEAADRDQVSITGASSEDIFVQATAGGQTGGGLHFRNIELIPQSNQGVYANTGASGSTIDTLEFINCKLSAGYFARNVSLDTLGGMALLVHNCNGSAQGFYETEGASGTLAPDKLQAVDNYMILTEWWTNDNNLATPDFMLVMGGQYEIATQLQIADGTDNSHWHGFRMKYAGTNPAFLTSASGASLDDLSWTSIVFQTSNAGGSFCNLGIASGGGNGLFIHGIHGFPIAGLTVTGGTIFIEIGDSSNAWTSAHVSDIFAPEWPTLFEGNGSALGDTHALLSTTHSDTTAAAVTRGGMVIGVGATPKWTLLTKGAAGALLGSDGTDLTWSIDNRIAGYLNVGSASAPTDTDAGDLTYKHGFGLEHHLVHTASENDDHALEIDVIAGGFSDVKAIEVTYTTGALAAGEDEEALLVNLDEDAANSGRFTGYEMLTTTTGGLKVEAVFAGANVHPVEHLSGTFGNPALATVEGVDKRTDLINPATNVTLFVADTDVVIVGNATKFQELEWILSTGASGAGIKAKFEFSSGAGPAWTEFGPTDGTNNFRNTGIMAWENSDIGAWVAVSSNFQIRITRTRATLGTSPVCSFLQMATTIEYGWDKTAILTVAHMFLHNASGTEVAELDITGNADFAGYLHAGGAGDPTNTTAGDITGTRGFITSGLRIGSTTAPTVPLDVTGAALFSSTVGVAGLLSVTGGAVTIGAELTGGLLIMHGSTSNEGAEIRLHLADNVDTQFASWNMDVSADDWRWFQSDSKIAMVLKGHATAPTVEVTNSLSVGSTTLLGVAGTSASALEVRGTAADGALSADNVRIGIISGTPRIVFEDAASATLWDIDNSAGTLRLFVPGVLHMTMSTTLTKFFDNVQLAKALDHDGTTVGFYGTTPIVQAVLATGAGATVDNVITALQNLGLVKQS